MAEDDPYDYAFGQFPDVNPPGTMSPLGLRSDDPLIDWGSNMRPADLAQYVHDPQGFVNKMVDSGQAPPNHNYMQGADGQLQPVDQHNLPIVRTNEQGRIQGNLSDYLNPPTRQTAAQAVAPPGRPSRALGYTDITTGAEVPGTPSDTELREKKGSTGDLLNIPPDAPIRQPGQILGPKVLPKLRNPSEVPEGTTPLPRPSPLRQTPAELPEVAPEPQPGSTPAKRAEEKKDKVEPLSSEAMSDFAKSLQGVKMPQRPNFQPMGAPAVRSPVGIHPEIQSLLSAIGQARPSPQQVALMRLLGRA